MQSPSRTLLLLWAMGIFLVSVPARAQTAEQRVAAHIKQFKLPTKVVERTVANRRVRRVFFPVLEKTAAPLASALLGADKGMAALLARPPSQGSNEAWNHYVRLALSPDKVYASKYDTFTANENVGPKAEGETARRALAWEKGNRYLLMDVGREAVEGMERFLEIFHGWNQREGEGHYSYGEDAKHYQAVRGDKAGDTRANCMWWLTNLEHAPETNPGTPSNFMRLFDVRLTKGPQEIPSILMHAANEKLVYVGVAVESKMAFRMLSKAKLVGPEPERGGAAGAVRPKPDGEGSAP